MVIEINSLSHEAGMIITNPEEQGGKNGALWREPGKIRNMNENDQNEKTRGELLPTRLS